MIPTDLTPPEDYEPHMRDPRLSSLINWVWAGLGALGIAGIMWCGRSINEMNVQLAVIITQNSNTAAAIQRLDITDNRLDERLRELEQRK